MEKLYEPMSDEDLASFWNHSGMTDDMGELEEELMSRGFEDLWRPNGRRNRRLCADDKDGGSDSSQRTGAASAFMARDDRARFAKFVDRIVLRSAGGPGARVPVADRVEVYWTGAEKAA
jgi:hypothetical protein